MTPKTTDLLAAQDWSFPVPIFYGPGRVRELVSHCRANGISRPLVVTDRKSRDLAFMNTIADTLARGGLEYGWFTEVSPNPRDDEIVAGREQFRDSGHDGVIAIGGGSGMDGGKAIATVANSDLDLWSFEFERESPAFAAEHFPPLITIPTTAGTGAETEGTAMITETARMMKFCTWHPNFRPVATLLDPQLTLGLPSDLTAWTGCDALVHGIEAYCVPGFHPLCDGAALEGIRLVNRWLRVAVNEPSHLEARGAMLVGSCLAGIAFLKGLGLVHAISHMVGAEFDTHHGLTNAVVLPAALRFNHSAIEAEVRPMAEAMELADPSFEGFYAANCQLLDELQIPRTLGDIGIPLDSSARLAGKAVQDSAASTNPREISTDEAQAVIEDAIKLGR